MLVDLLLGYGSNTAVVENGRTICGLELLLMTEQLAQQLTTLGVHSVLLASDSALEALVALASCEITEVTVMLAPRSLPNDQIEDLVARYDIQAILRSTGDQLALFPTGQCADEASESFEVELMTSGTSGNRKIARYDLSRLMGRIRPGKNANKAWLLTYTPTAFAGIQVILTAVAGCSLLACHTSRDISEVIAVAIKSSVTHASGTPTFWRTWLLARKSFVGTPELEQITLGGEAVDQITLDRLAAAHPNARISQIYASTEAGVVFSVHDKREGFPVSWLSTGVDDVQLRVRDNVLEVRTQRRMNCYLSHHGEPLDGEGWLHTGDLVRIEGDRVLFSGRVDSMVNVAGHKVFPEDVERTLRSVTGVADAHVYPKFNPVTGNVLVADIACHAGTDREAVVALATKYVRENLSRHQQPALIRVVERMQTGESGKKQRFWE